MQPTLAPAPHPMRSSAVCSPVAASIETVTDKYNQESSADQRTSHRRLVPQMKVLLADTYWKTLDLRETLLAHHGGSNSHSPLQRIEAQQPHNSVHNLDPAIAGSGMMNRNAGDSGADDNNSDGKKGKRELSTSKRAAQNRQAQVCSEKFMVDQPLDIFCGNAKRTMFPLLLVLNDKAQLTNI